MSVAPQVPWNVTTGNGVSTVYPYSWQALQAGDIAVYWDGVQKFNGIDFTISGLGLLTGGNLTFFLAPPNGTRVTIARQMIKKRDTDYQQLGDFLTPVVNPDFDRALLISQELDAADARSIRVAPYEQGSNMLLPPKATRANQFLYFDASGDLSLAVVIASGTLSQSTIGSYLTPQTQAEIAAGVVPTSIFYPPNDIGRYGGVDDDLTDNTAAINNAILVGGTIRFPCRNLGVYRTAGGHVLADGVSLEGVGKRTGSPYRGSGLKLTANATMFTCIARNTIKSLELSTTTIASPFTAAGTAISIGTLAAYAGNVRIIDCRIIHFHVGIQNSGGLFGTVEDCSITNNNYGVYYYNTGATTSNSMVWKNNQIYANQRGGIFASVASRGIGHSFIGGSIEGNCSEDVSIYTAQVKGLVCGHISFRNVYMEYANGAVAGPNFIDAAGMSDGGIEDCYFNLSASTSGTGIISAGAGCSRFRIQNNRFLGANFTNDINLPACTGIRAWDNNFSVATSIITGAGSQNITTRLAPTANRETSFTPVAQGTGTPGAQTYSVQQGYYTQVDNLVHFRLRLTMTAKDGATAGNLQVGGLPVAAAASANGFALFAVGVENLTQSAARTQFVGRLSPNGAAIDIMESGSNVPLLATVAANLQATTSLYVSGVYAVANPT